MNDTTTVNETRLIELVRLLEDCINCKDCPVKNCDKDMKATCGESFIEWLKEAPDGSILS